MNNAHIHLTNRVPNATDTVTTTGLYYLHSRRFAGTASQAGSLGETLDTTHPLAHAHSPFGRHPGAVRHNNKDGL